MLCRCQTVSYGPLGLEGTSSLSCLFELYFILKLLHKFHYFPWLITLLGYSHNTNYPQRQCVLTWRCILAVIILKTNVFFLPIPLLGSVSYIWYCLQISGCLHQCYILKYTVHNIPIWTEQCLTHFLYCYTSQLILLTCTAKLIISSPWPDSAPLVLLSPGLGCDPI